MTHTVFVDDTTVITASWLNDVDTSVYTTVPAEIARATAAENARPTSATLAAAGGAALIGNTPAGNIASTTVQAALNELDTEKALLAGSASQVFSVATPTTANHAVPRGFFSPITASLGADVALNNTANFFDGPSIAQGTAGTWFVSGTVTLLDTAGGAAFFLELWDGTTVIASSAEHTELAGHITSVSLSGFITNPAGNLRISVKDVSSTSGVIKYNSSGSLKDSTITAIRVG